MTTGYRDRRLDRYVEQARKRALPCNAAAEQAATRTATTSDPASKSDRNAPMGGRLFGPIGGRRSAANGVSARAHYKTVRMAAGAHYSLLCLIAAVTSNGTYEADRSQVYRWKGTEEAAGDQGRSQERAGHRWRQEAPSLQARHRRPP